MTPYSIQEMKNTNFAIASLFFIQGILFSCIASRVPDFRNLLGINDAELGVLLLAIPMGQICTMLLSGYLISKYSSRAVLKYSVFGYPAALLCTLLTNSYFFYLPIFFVFGVFANLINVSINTQASRAEINFKKTLMPKFHGVWSLASALGGVLGIILIKFDFSMSWHYILATVFYLCLGNYVIQFLFIKDKEDVSTQNESSSTSFKLTFFLLFCGIIGFSSALAEGIMFNWSSLYFKDIVKVSHDLSGIGYISCMSAMVIGRFTVAYFIEKLGKPRIIQICGILVACGLGLSTSMPYFIPSVIGMFLLGLGSSAIVPMVYSYAGAANPEHSGKAMTTVVSITFLGFMCGPPLIGFLSHLFSLRIAFMPMIVIGLCIALSSFYFQKNSNIV